MTRGVDETQEAPAEWFRLLWEHQGDLAVVQVQWRRSNFPYRPLVPEHINPDLIPEDEWERHERDDTNILWELGEVEDAEERREMIFALVSKLWTIARRWTELRGAWCDFRLIGHDGSDEQLFCCGRRCRPHPSQQDGADPSAIDERPSWHKVLTAHTHNLESVISHVRSERDEATKRANKSLQDSHLMWSQLSDAMRDTAQFQREQMEAANSMRSGAVELRARAFQAIQETERIKAIVGGVQNTVETLLGNLVPLTDRIAKQFGGDRVVADQTFPKFEHAQQALRYLALTLTDTQLKLLFPKSREAGEDLRTVLRLAGDRDTEIAALADIGRLIMVLRSTEFRDLTTPEQQQCTAYIIGRLAMYKTVGGDVQDKQQAQA